MKLSDFIKNIKIKLSPKTGALYAFNLLQFEQKKNLLEQNILYQKDSGVTHKKYCNHQIIVSLTTYSKRLYDVCLTIESIMEQTMKPNRIILWLDYSYQHQRLPESLHLLENRGLEIMYCEDLRSYKKLIPSLQEFPNDAIITIDDDTIYNFDTLENLINNYLDNMNLIYCNRQHIMRLTSEGSILPYSQWIQRSKDEKVNILNFPTGCGGILYPPNSLDKEVMNKEVFMKICPYADDVWFKAMALKKGTLCRKVHTSYTITGNEFITNETCQDIGLRNINVEGEALNDKQIQAVFSKYNLFKLLNK